MRSSVLFLILLLCAPAHAASLWDHNGSTVSLEASGANRKFFYQAPRPGLPVAAGTLLFSGTRNGTRYSGTAYVFSERCGAIGYQVSGSVTADDRSITMYGRAPLKNGSCNVVAYRDDVLVFTYLPPAEPQVAFQAATPSVNCQELYDSLQELQARGSLKVISTLAEELERYCLPWKAEQDAQRLRDEQERLAQQDRERREQEARDEQIRQAHIAEEALHQASQRALYGVRTVESAEPLTTASDWLDHLVALARIFMVFSLAAPLVLLGFFLYAKGVAEPKSLAEDAAAIGVFGFLFGIACTLASRYGILGDFNREATLLSLTVWLYGGVLGFMAIGALTRCRFSKDQLHLRLSTIIGLSVLVALACVAGLVMHAQSQQHFDALLFIGIMFSWVFVFGFVLSDPSIAPLLQRLDKLPSAAHNVLKSMYESMRSPNLPAVVPGSQTLDIPDASSFQRMQLKLKRSQRRGLAGKMIFVFDARMEVPREEYGLIQEVPTWKPGDL
jgi:hypothetical protein